MNDIEKIKEDIKNLVTQLKNIKDKSGSDILEQLAFLSSAITKFRNNNNNKKNSNSLKWCSYYSNILNHPIKNIAYMFATYAIFSIIFKRNK